MIFFIVIITLQDLQMWLEGYFSQLAERGQLRAEGSVRSEEDSGSTRDGER